MSLNSLDLQPSTAIQRPNDESPAPVLKRKENEPQLESMTKRHKFINTEQTLPSSARPLDSTMRLRSSASCGEANVDIPKPPDVETKPLSLMKNQQSVFLAYRAIFSGVNGQVRKRKSIRRMASQHFRSNKTLRDNLEEEYVVQTLQTLLERGIFSSDVRARAAFPNLFVESAARDEQHAKKDGEARREQAEALKNVESSEEDREWGRNGTAIKQPTKAPIMTTQEIPNGVATNGIAVPSLYPIYMPFSIQHLMLTRTQSLLEQCCYKFTLKWLPEMLAEWGWTCQESIELNRWVGVVVFARFPVQAFASDSTTSVSTILNSVIQIRHSAVHRYPITARSISELIYYATHFAKFLRDTACEKLLHELQQELDSKTRELDTQKTFLESTLEREMHAIARQRKELKEREKRARATMLKEDRDYGAQISVLLAQSLNKILDKNENEEAGFVGVEQSEDQDLEIEMEIEEEEKVDEEQYDPELPALSHDSTHQEEHDSLPEAEVALNSITEVEVLEPGPKYQSFDTTKPDLTLPSKPSFNKVDGKVEEEKEESHKRKDDQPVSHYGAYSQEELDILNEPKLAKDENGLAADHSFTCQEEPGSLIKPDIILDAATEPRSYEPSPEAQPLPTTGQHLTSPSTPGTSSSNDVVDADEHHTLNDSPSSGSETQQSTTLDESDYDKKLWLSYRK